MTPSSLTVTWPLAPSVSARTDSSCHTPLVATVVVLVWFTPATSLR